MIRLARFAAAGVLAVICPLAAGQVGGTVHSFEDLISRPSTSGASNLIGGRYTRAGEVDLLRAPKRDVGLLQQDRMSYFRATSRSPRGRVVPSSQLGVFETLAPPRGNPLSLMLTRRESVAEITGLSGAMDFRLPLPGRNEGELPAISASAYTPRPQTTQFQAYFGLRSTTPPTSTATLTSYYGALNESTDARVRRIAAEGVALFRRGTVERPDPATRRYPTCTDCADLLDQAVRKLRQARDLDSTADLPSILLLHAALEQDRPSLAIVYLTDAFRRNPEVFRNVPEALDTCFGDSEGGQKRSEWLVAQMRRYTHHGDMNPKSVEAQLLQAYCAWRLGDLPRVRSTALTALTLLRDTQASDITTAVETNMAIALQGL